MRTAPCGSGRSMRVDTDHWTDVRSPAGRMLRKGVFVSVVAALVLTVYANGQPRTRSTTPRTSTRIIVETAHLKLINDGENEVYVYHGSIKGTFDMALTLTLHNIRHGGSYKSVAPNGSLSGEVEITAAAQVVRHGKTIITFDATGDISRGTGAYRGYYAHNLKLSGAFKHGHDIVDMTVSGHLHRVSRSRR